jgi:hypothetical protein
MVTVLSCSSVPFRYSSPFRIQSFQAPAYAASILTHFLVMLRPRDALVWGLLVSCTSGLDLGAGADAGAGASAGTIAHHKGRRLQGRFLHVTGE